MARVDGGIVPDDGRRRLGDLQLVPGMPAEVFYADRNSHDDELVAETDRRANEPGACVER
jgi:hypothetical protein